MRVGAPNQSLRLIIIYYIFKYSFGIKKNFAIVTSELKKTFKDSILAQLVKRASFLSEVNFIRLVGALKESL